MSNVSIVIFCEHTITGGIKKIKEWTKEVTTSKAFSSSENSFDISGAVSGSYGVASASVSASYSEMKKASRSSEGTHEKESSKEVTFDTKCRALVRVVTTQITVNGISATEKNTQYVDVFFEKDKRPTASEMRKRSCRFMADRYDSKDKESTKVVMNFTSKRTLDTNAMAKLEKKWRDKHTQYIGWVKKYGGEKNTYGERETAIMVDMLHKLKLKPSTRTLTDFIKTSKGKREQFKTWYKKHGGEKNEYGKREWAAFYDDCQSLEF